MLAHRISRRWYFLGSLAALTAAACPAALARPEFAQKEGVSCNYCHVVAGRGRRNFRGMYYQMHGLSFADFDNIYEAKIAGVSPDAMGPDAVPTVPGYRTYKAPPALDYTLKDIDGKPVKLARYLGNVILVVNVASKCGFTPQYAGLEKLYEKYKARGLTILGFPANEFHQQEPGTNSQIKAFCSTKYNVTFPMFSKIVVKGQGQHPFYTYLTSPTTDPQFKGDIGWNFTKFLINRNGEIASRFPSDVTPTSQKVVSEIDKLLAEAASPAP